MDTSCNLFYRHKKKKLCQHTYSQFLHFSIIVNEKVQLKADCQVKKFKVGMYDKKNHEDFPLFIKICKKMATLYFSRSKYNMGVGGGSKSPEIEKCNIWMLPYGLKLIIIQFFQGSTVEYQLMLCTAHPLGEELRRTQ